MSNNYIKDIQEFDDRFYQTGPTVPTPLPMRLHNFRTKFMQEELDEFITASNTNDMEDCLDALVDLAYILFGTVTAMGLSNVFNKAWDEVHKCNMNKIRATLFSNGMRDAKYDIVKPANWVGPNLKQFLGKNNE